MDTIDSSSVRFFSSFCKNNLGESTAMISFLKIIVNERLFLENLHKLFYRFFFRIFILKKLFQKFPEEIIGNKLKKKVL